MDGDWYKMYNEREVVKMNCFAKMKVGQDDKLLRITAGHNGSKDGSKLMIFRNKDCYRYETLGLY